MTTRRSFMAGILAAGMAPAIARSGILMPLGKIWTPPSGGLTLDALRRVVAQLDAARPFQVEYERQMYTVVRYGTSHPEAYPEFENWTHK